MIWELLLTGKRNAISCRTLSQLLKVSPRIVTRAVEMERRKKGKPICSVSNGNNRGYYLAESREELLECCSRLKHRGIEVLTTMSAMKRTADRMTDEADRK